jgi:hypothetical protein
MASCLVEKKWRAACLREEEKEGIRVFGDGGTSRGVLWRRRSAGGHSMEREEDMAGFSHHFS